MPTLSLALLQLTGHGADVPWALAEGERACREAAARGADVAVFPEMWQIGYAPCPQAAEHAARWGALATGADDAFVARFRALARELEMAIVVTYLQRWAPEPRNAATLIDRHGDVVLTYAKVHTCDFGMERVLTPGTEFPVANLDTAAGPVRTGMMICFDREFPEPARALMLAGAELILVPNACVLDAERIGQFRTRAFENMLAVAMGNYAQGTDDCNGHSIAFSGVCYDTHGRPCDQQLVEAGNGSEIAIARLDLDALRAYRGREPWGDAYRKPDAYTPLLDDSAEPAFARPRARRRGRRAA